MHLVSAADQETVVVEGEAVELLVAVVQVVLGDAVDYLWAEWDWVESVMRGDSVEGVFVDIIYVVVKDDSVPHLGK